MTFYAKDGTKIDSVTELEDFLRTISYDTFNHHVGPSHNHFADWIKNELHDPDLAGRISDIKKPGDMLFELQKKRRLGNLGSLKDMIEESKRRLAAQEEILKKLEQDTLEEAYPASEEPEDEVSFSDDLIAALERESTKIMAAKSAEPQKPADDDGLPGDHLPSMDQDQPRQPKFDDLQVETMSQLETMSDNPFERIPIDELRQSRDDPVFPQEYSSFDKKFSDPADSDEPDSSGSDESIEEIAARMQNDIKQMEQQVKQADQGGMKKKLGWLYGKRKKQVSAEEMLSNVPIPTSPMTRTETALMQIMIKECEDLLGQGKKEDAKLKYMDLRNEFTNASLPEEIKAQYYDQVRAIYDRLA